MFPLMLSECMCFLLDQDYDDSGTEGPFNTLPDLLSRVVKLDEAADSAICEVDTSQTSTIFPIEEATSFESLLNISADEEVLPKASETLQYPATPPNPWRTRQKKKKRSRRPPIAFKSDESEIEALFDTCAPPPGQITAERKLSGSPYCKR